MRKEKGCFRGFGAAVRSQTGYIGLLLSMITLWTLLFFLDIPSSYAQGPTFGEPRLFGTGSDGTESVVLGDVNGDGALDLIVGNRHHTKDPEESLGEQNTVCLNDGAGNFPLIISHNVGTVEEATNDVAVGDFNGDGALDIVVVNGGWTIRQNAVYLNDGAGSFPNTSVYTRAFGTGVDLSESVAVGDMDGDGHLDIVVGNYEEQSVVYLNDGTGSFPNTSAYTRTFATSDDVARSVAVGDIDGDGSLDIIVGDPWNQNVVYLNDGTGSFPNTNVYTRAFGTATDDTYSLAVGDLNDDDALDIVVGNRDELNAVYLNDGTGTFSYTSAYTRAFGTVSEETFDVALGDVNGDGALDIVVGNTDQNAIYLNDNDGSANFSTSLDFGTGSDGSFVTVGDVNGDSALDIVVGGFQKQNMVYLNDGAGIWDNASTFGTDDTYSVAVGDVDSDGHLDAVFGKGAQGGPILNEIYLNNGDGVLSDTLTFGGGRTRSVALGDLNGDDALDIIFGNEDTWNWVYVNDGSGSFSASDYFDSSETHSVALGDVDGDGDLDIVVGNVGTWNRVYLNDGTGDFATFRGFGAGSDTTRSVALGDVDGDGDLDIVVGNGPYSGGEQNVVYLNDGAGNFDWPGAARNFGTDWGCTYSVALGDLNGDGFLDIVAGNAGWPGEQNVIYLNDGTGNFAPDDTRLLGMEQDWTYSVALGDIDGDGDLDVVVGNRGGGGPPGEQNLVYLNDGTGDFGWSTPIRTLGTSPDETYGVAVGDLNDDGSLDVVVGNGDQGDVVHLNALRQRSGLGNSIPYPNVIRPTSTANANFLSTPVILDSLTIPIAYTLFDLEGDPVGGVAAYYSPDGGGLWFPAVATGDTVTANIPITEVIFFEGFENTGNATYTQTVGSLPGAPNVGYVNTSPECRLRTQAGPGFYRTGTHAATVDRYPSGSVQRNYLLVTVNMSGYDAAVDPVVLDFSFMHHGEEPHDNDRVWVRGSNSSSWIQVVNLNAYQKAAGTYLTLTDIDVSQALLLGGQNFSSSFQVLFGQEDDSPAITTTYSDGYTFDDIILRLAPWKREMTYTWDTFASGFFGQSDNVVLRFVASPQPAQTSAPGTHRYTSTVPGPYLWPYASATTFPFRVRGTQVRVLSSTVPVSNAIVYRLPEGQLTDGILIADGTGNPFRTDEQGYLQGRGEIYPGDHLLAMLPVTWTESYTLYYTSGSPALTGVDAYTVTAPGVQTLTVSADNPLILFNLDVSLEWDAHNDTAYLDQLQFNLQRASEHLYDFTNGQVALGNVNVFQNGDEWIYSHVVVQANNRLRPFAAQGGVVFTDTIDPQHNTVSDTILYGPGQVTMGSTWNRYGNPGQSLGEDWPIILAHELSHYLLFHDDTYIGMNPNGYLVPISTCLGSAMGDLYSNPDNTEFIADEGYWQANCADTLAEQTLERNEWETMQLWYPGLVTPTAILSGPTTMPFDFTTVVVHDPYTPTDTLVDPTFYIDYQGGGGSSSEARAYLDRDEYVVNLGSPFGGQNRVIAHGAKPGDRLCVFDRQRAQFGCETVEIGDDRLAMRLDADWNPIVQISPVNSTTLTIQFTSTAPIPFPLYARIFPDLGYGEDPILLTLVGGVYSGTFELTYPAMSGNVQVWVDEPFTETEPRREVMVALSIGGNPGMQRGAGGMQRGAGGMQRGAGGMQRGAGGMQRGAGAPIVSADGQMIFFTENPIDFAVGTFFTIQGMAGLPPLPPGRTLVGQGYSLVASPGVSLPFGSVSIQYLSNDVLVAGASEEDLTLYFWDGDSWTALNTVLDTYFNLVSAPSQGEGVYALMASMRVPLYAPGWNMFAYPLQTTQPVSDALRSIEGYYATVYGYRAEDSLDPWEVYQVGGPGYLNDLSELEPARGYWISATQAITIYFSNVMVLTAQDGSPASPPDTYYGTIEGNATFTPVVGMEVQAWIGGVLCGRGLTQEYAEQIVYVVDVMADDGVANVGCGQLGRRVVLTVDGQQMVPTILWDNSQLNEVPLTPASVVYLPLVMRNR